MYTRNFYNALYQTDMLSCSNTFCGGVMYTPMTSYTGAVKNVDDYMHSQVTGHIMFGYTGATYTYAPSLWRLCYIGGNSSSCGGVAFGTGTTAPTIDDYDLESRITSGITIHSYYFYKTCDENGLKCTVQYVLKNTTSEDITITEIGAFNQMESTYFLLERTVLSEPVTVPAGGMNHMVYVINALIPPEA